MITHSADKLILLTGTLWLQGFRKDEQQMRVMFPVAVRSVEGGTLSCRLGGYWHGILVALWSRFNIVLLCCNSIKSYIISVMRRSAKCPDWAAKMDLRQLAWWDTNVEFEILPPFTSSSQTEKSKDIWQWNVLILCEVCDLMSKKLF